MARIAATEEADGIRDEEDVSSANEQAVPSDGGHAHMRGPSHSTQDNQMEEDSIPQLHVPKLKYVIVTSSPGDILGRPEMILAIPASFSHGP